jgi:hypothetical protein
LTNPHAEIVKSKPKKSGKGLNASTYSKKGGFGLKNSTIRSSKLINSSKNLDYVDSRHPSTGASGRNQSSSRIELSRASSSKGLNNSRNDSKVMSANNTSKDLSLFLRTDEEKSSMNLDVNKTYKTILALDPAERLRPKKKQGGKDAAETSKLNYEDYTKGKPKEYRPEEVYDPKEQAFTHFAAQKESKAKRDKQVAAFMNTLQREMEERKVKERRDDLKKKINMKVPKKVQLEDFLAKSVI